uniref:SpoVT-AbrB domain-containing protein n=1 Tax=viral metagenome TaxID=1070528 RepID=A0A6C0EPY5_9ZZZZ
MVLTTKLRVNKANGQANISIPKALRQLLNWNDSDEIIISFGISDSIILRKNK